jgi:hypothetical protein
MNADEVEIMAATAGLGGIVSAAQHRDRVTYLMRNGARAAAVVPVMMVNQWIRDEAILRLLKNGIPVHLTAEQARRPVIRVSIEGDSLATGTPGRVVLEAVPPLSGPDRAEARDLAERAARILRAVGYEVSEERAEAPARRCRARYRVRRPYASWARS